MYGFYFIVVFLGILVAYAGFEETMNLFVYADLQVRYAFIRGKMKWMGWKLKRQLARDATQFQNLFKEYNNEHKDLS